MIYADCFSRMGKSHNINQDYACHQKFSINDEFGTFALVSDGCSSAPDSDYGARLLAQAAERDFSTWGNRFDPLRIIKEAEHMARSIGKPVDCLDATLLLANTCPQSSHVNITICGDGVIALRRRESNVPGKPVVYDYLVFEFSNNAPGYLRYTLNPLYLQQYFSMQEEFDLPEPSGIQKVTRKIADGERFGPMLQFFMKDGGTCYSAMKAEKDFFRTFDPYSSTTHELGPECLKSFFASMTTIYQRDYDLVLIGTDGLQSFYRFNDSGMKEPIGIESVLDQVMQVKQPKGEFLKRRMTKFVDKFCPKMGWFHEDDLSVAALFLDDMGGESHEA